MTSRAAAVLLLAASLAACKSEVVCTSDQVTCDGQCISLASDPANCGACGRSCGAGESCSAGLCCQGAQCPPAVYAACFNGSAVQGATATPVAVGAPVAVEIGPHLARLAGDLALGGELHQQHPRPDGGLARPASPPTGPSPP